MNHLNEHPLFSLVESRTLPTTSAALKKELREGEAFESDFIGASVQDCRSWAFDKQSKVNWIEFNIIAIADQRLALDNTILIERFFHESYPFDKYGMLPPEPRTWTEWRIEYRHTPEVFAAVVYTAPDVTFPVYIGQQKQLTQNNGIFDVDRAERVILGEESNISSIES
jgi:hypothetical protein